MGINMEQSIKEVCQDRLNIDLFEIIISNSSQKEQISKIKVRPIQIKEAVYFQASEYREKKVFHTNYNKEEFLEKLEKWVDGTEEEFLGLRFKQIEIKSRIDTVIILISKRGKASIKRKDNPTIKKITIEEKNKDSKKINIDKVNDNRVNVDKIDVNKDNRNKIDFNKIENNEVGKNKTDFNHTDDKQVDTNKAGFNKIESKERNDIPILLHNRVKNYILKEYTPIPFLIDLGVMTKEGKIVNSKYDKFKQINRFLELIEDVLPSLAKGKELTIIDFGCGKSYLTFAMYYYLKEIKGYPIQMIGLDLKHDVIKKCNELSEKYKYTNLKFLHGDIASYEGVQEVDMVVTLHACDTATDYALYKAVQWNAKVILSVPCCQHEVNKQINCEPFKEMFKYGLIKERTAALLTDALRANQLELQGYKTQILEFIDMEHTPKNILIRAIKGKKIDTSKKIKFYQDITKFFGIEPLLGTLFEKDFEKKEEL